MLIVGWFRDKNRQYLLRLKSQKARSRNCTICSVSVLTAGTYVWASISSRTIHHPCLNDFSIVLPRMLFLARQIINRTLQLTNNALHFIRVAQVASSSSRFRGRPTQRPGIFHPIFALNLLHHHRRCCYDIPTFCTNVNEIQIKKKNTKIEYIPIHNRIFEWSGHDSIVWERFFFF